MTPMPIAPNAPLSIVINSKSGKQPTDPFRPALTQLLGEAGRAFSLHEVKDPSRLAAVATEAVAEACERGGVVVVAGGDGSINTVAQATLGSGRPMAVLPRGTFNYFSRTHGISSDLNEAVQVMLGARAHPVQAGLVNGRLFLVNASLGLYPQLLEDREAYKKQFGRSRLVALVAAVSTLLRGHHRLRLRIEGDQAERDLETPTLFVGNNQLQLEQIGIDEATRLEEGRLVGIVLKPLSSTALVKLGLRGAFGQLGAADEVSSFAFRRISVTPRQGFGVRRVKVATDGEVVWMKGPLEFKVAREPLWLLRPDPAPDALKATLP